MNSLKHSKTKIQQIIIEGFDSVDRCTSCHLGVDNKDFADEPQPYSLHPLNESLMSKHPVDKFGCTICHQGQGRATTVRDAHATEERVRKTWLSPMLGDDYVYSSCKKCHDREYELSGADSLNEGRRLVEKYACYGCHNIKGLKNKKKAGPVLDDVADRAYFNWIAAWIKNPKQYVSTAKMPNFKLSGDEVETLVAYLMQSYTGKYEAETPSLPKHDDEMVKQGASLVKERGCIGCHKIGSEGETFAPELTYVGDKLRKPYVIEWLLNPKEFQPETLMPDMRLSRDEAEAIAQYLSTLKKETAIGSPSFSRKDLENPKLVKKGKKLILHYGCYGCHDIKGIDETGAVAPDLNGFADKEVEKLSFGDAKKVEKTLTSWTYNKIKNPRLYHTEKVPVKMPDFGFTDEQARNIAVFVLGLSEERVPWAYPKPDFDESSPLNVGRENIRKYNCAGCHFIEDRGGKIGPNLSIEGARVKPLWLLEFLKEPTEIRPGIKAKMPTFNLADQEIASLIRYFFAVSGEEFLLKRQRRIVISEKRRVEGLSLVKEFKCYSCHEITGYSFGALKKQYQVKEEVRRLAPDLYHAPNRLDPDWVARWLKNPQSFIEDTKMPNFKLTEQQIQVLRDFILSSRSETVYSE